jgi:hypothetical protein
MSTTTRPFILMSALGRSLAYLYARRTNLSCRKPGGSDSSHGRGMHLIQPIGSLPVSDLFLLFSDWLALFSESGASG